MKDAKVSVAAPSSLKALASFILAINPALPSQFRDLSLLHGSQRTILGDSRRSVPMRCTQIEMGLKNWPEQSPDAASSRAPLGIEDLEKRAKESQQNLPGLKNWLKQAAEPQGVDEALDVVDPSLLSKPGSGELLATDPRLVTVELDRYLGISWGTDLSRRWTYVFEMASDGSALLSGQVQLGDALVSVAGDRVLGKSIGDVMDIFAKTKGDTIELVFFRGGIDKLKEIVAAKPPETVMLTVKRIGESDLQFEIPYGANLRDELIARQVNVYKSINRVTNCNGKQLCGTCFVDILEGYDSCNAKDRYEAKTLEQNPDSYRLSCVTYAYGNLTVQLLPKRGWDQLFAVGGPR